MKKKRSERRKHCAIAGCSKVRTRPARPLSQTHRQDRLQYTAPQLASPGCVVHQWRSKALRGHGSTVTWGSYLSLPSTSSPSPPPSPPLSIFFPTPAQPPAAKRPQIQGLGSAVSSPSRVWGGAPAEIEFGAF